MITTVYPKGALPAALWRSYGFLQSGIERSLREFYLEVVGVIESAGGSLRRSYGLRFSQINSRNKSEFNINRDCVAWERIFPLENPEYYLRSEFLITPGDIGSHPAFNVGHLSFQADFCSGWMMQFEICFSNSVYAASSPSANLRVEEEVLLKSPPWLLELRGCTDLSLRFKDLTIKTLPPACDFYDFWKGAALTLKADLCCGGYFMKNDVIPCQSASFAAFQFARGLPRWGTRPFEERRMPSKAELEKTLNAHMWIDECKENLEIRRPWPYPQGIMGTIWWDPGEFTTVLS